eukprot:scpid91054/ scgid32500/ 
MSIREVERVSHIKDRACKVCVQHWSEKFVPFVHGTLSATRSSRLLMKETTSPVNRTESAYFAINYHFTLRGCENQEPPGKQDLLLKVADDGTEFIELAPRWWQQRKGERWKNPTSSAGHSRQETAREDQPEVRSDLSDGMLRPTSERRRRCLVQRSPSGPEHN